MTQYKIVPIAEEHIPGFWRAVDSVSKEREFLAFLEAPPIETTYVYVRENIKDKRPHYVALVDGSVVGWCDITSLNRPIYAHAGVLGMGITKEFRGIGIGSELMKQTLERAKQIGLTRVSLFVRENNHPAMNLYKKMGFEIEGFHRNAVLIGMTYENYYSLAILLSHDK
jgi:ribosomal protein S18 acetylase RimI-like enzyme